MREVNLDGHDSSQLQMMDEMCLLVDSEDRVIGSETKLDCHRNEGSRHRAFSVLSSTLKEDYLFRREPQRRLPFQCLG